MKFDVAAKFDVIIVGSGMSGLICALELAKNGKSVCILAKEAVTEGASLYAQGGIAVPLGEGDSVEKHVMDTVKAGAGLTNPNIAKDIISYSVQALERLISYGVKFDVTTQEKIHFTKEAAHSVPRVCHVGGDTSGKYITKILIDKACREQNISISQGTAALAILFDEKECATGILVEDVTKNHYALLADDVILATGGVGQIFENTTNPKVSTGDGIAMAYRAGAELQDTEMVQFHPTVLLDKGDPFLISEAVRGEGAKLKNIKGEYFAKDYHEAGELAPRDVLSRAILFEMQKTNSNRVFLDVSNFKREYFVSRFPTIYQTCIDRNSEPFINGIPVAPAAHYYIGGIKSDLYGATGIKNLWTIGECASSGFHGANRLASNSLLECIVSPHFLVQKILGSSKKSSYQFSFIEIELDNNNYDEKVVLNLMQNLKKKNSTSLGLLRTKLDMEKHLAFVESMTEVLNIDKLSLHFQVQELKNMLLLSNLICQASLKREHSIGVHYREDFPKLPHELKHSIIQKNRGLYWLSQKASEPVISKSR